MFSLRFRLFVIHLVLHVLLNHVGVRFDLLGHHLVCSVQVFLHCLHLRLHLLQKDLRLVVGVGNGLPGGIVDLGQL